MKSRMSTVSPKTTLKKLLASSLKSCQIEYTVGIEIILDFNQDLILI